MKGEHSPNHCRDGQGSLHWGCQKQLLGQQLNRILQVWAAGGCRASRRNSADRGQHLEPAAWGGWSCCVHLPIPPCLPAGHVQALGCSACLYTRYRYTQDALKQTTFILMVGLICFQKENECFWCFSLASQALLLVLSQAELFCAAVLPCLGVGPFQPSLGSRSVLVVLFHCVFTTANSGGEILLQCKWTLHFF